MSVYLKVSFKVLIMTLFLQISHNIFSQNITGYIVDKKNNHIEFATVSLYTNSIKVKTTISDSLGKFSFNNVPKGNIKIQTSFIGYVSNEIVFSYKNDTVMNMLLVNDSKNLQEVTVNSKKPLIERKVDRLVFNVENSIMASSEDAYTALKYTPLIGITENGINIIGKGTVAVMVNDKIIHLSDEQLINYLKTIPASNISRIEVITNPPAQYEAAGSYGLINIVLKKFTRLGYNGDAYFGYNQAYYSKLKAGTSLYYNLPKTKISASINTGDGSVLQTISNSIFYPSQTWKLDEQSQQYAKYISGALGIEQEFTKKNSLSIDYTGYYNQPNISEKNITAVYNQNNQIDSLLYSNSFTTKTIDNHTISSQFTHLFDTLGRKMVLTADYIFYKENRSLPFSSITKNASGIIIDTTQETLSKGIQTCNIGTLNALFVSPIKKGELNFGCKLSFTGNKDDVSFFNQFNNVWQVDTSQSNLFYYRENTQATFASYKNSYKKWNYQIGLRSEFTELKGGYNQIFTQLNTSYFKIFPTVYLTYQPNDNNSFSLNYSKRIERPAYLQLNPFKWNISQYTYVEGNPTLQPSFIQSFELSYNYKGILNTSASVSRMTNGFTQINYVYPNNNNQFITAQNVYDETDFGLYVYYIFNKMKWLETTFQNVLTYEESNTYNTAIFPNRSGWNFYSSINNQIYFNKNKTFIGSCSFSYSSLDSRGISYLQPWYLFSAGMKILILKKKASINISGEDIFKTLIYKRSFLINNILQYRTFNPGWQSLRITFQYKFGNSKIKQHKNQSAAEDEKNRLN
jgi:hypothetical protein